MKLLKTSLILSLTLGLISCQAEQKQKPKLALTENPESLEVFAEGIISTQFYERDIAVSPDGDEIVYTLGDYKQSKRVLVLLKKTNETWSDPRILPFSGEYQDIEPFFTHDGHRLFFASDRPINDSSQNKDYNIWYSERKNATWSKPVALGEKINTKGNEFYPSLGKSGNLYFTATREDGIGREDIFLSKFENGAYQEPNALDTLVNTKYFEFNAYISPDEDLLVFSSFGREDDLGGGDLYYSKKDKNGNWRKAIHLESPINSDKLDYCPFIDFQGNNFYFTSERTKSKKGKFISIDDLKRYANKPQNGLGDIYRIGLDEIVLE